MRKEDKRDLMAKSKHWPLLSSRASLSGLDWSIWSTCPLLACLACKSTLQQQSLDCERLPGSNCSRLTEASEKSNLSALRFSISIPLPYLCNYLTENNRAASAVMSPTRPVQPQIGLLRIACATTATIITTTAANAQRGTHRSSWPQIFLPKLIINLTICQSIKTISIEFGFFGEERPLFSSDHASPSDY